MTVNWTKYNQNKNNLLKWLGKRSESSKVSKISYIPQTNSEKMSKNGIF